MPHTKAHWMGEREGLQRKGGGGGGDQKIKRQGISPDNKLHKMPHTKAHWRGGRGGGERDWCVKESVFSISFILLSQEYTHTHTHTHTEPTHTPSLFLHTHTHTHTHSACSGLGMPVCLHSWAEDFSFLSKVVILSIYFVLWPSWLFPQTYILCWMWGTWHGVQTLWTWLDKSHPTSASLSTWGMSSKKINNQQQKK